MELKKIGFKFMERKNISYPVVVFLLLALVIGGVSCKKPPANKEPIAQFSASPKEGNEPLIVQFNDLSVSEDSPIVSWYWDFGDGETSNLPNPRKTYYHNPKDGNNPSLYTVRLIISTGRGLTERKEVNYIRVNPGTTFSVIDPQQSVYNGVASGYGVNVRIPQGALTAKTTFSIYETKETKQFSFTEPMELVSSFYRIAHNAKTENLFAKSSDNKIVSTTLEIPLFPGEESRTDRPANRYLILALLDDGSIVPILGEKQGTYAIARITGLPYQATYVVGFFPTASIIDVPVTVPEDAKLNYPWNLKWRIFGSMPVIKQLVALEKGSMENPNSFYNENFSDAVISDSLTKLATKIAGVYVEYIASGMRNPILVDQDGAYGVVFFNMNSNYTSEYEDFNQLAIANRKFGNIVIDPKQLLMVSIHNALTALNDTTNTDIKQKFTPYNIFAQYLFYSCFDNYQFPDLTIPDPSNIDIYGKPQMVSYFKGIRESIAIYLGQRADRVVEEIEAKSTKADTARTWARSFEENEYLDLSQALFQPVSMKTKNYYNAGHEFWVYLERKLTDIPILALIGASGDPYGGFLQELEKVFKESVKPQQVVNYELATTLTYATLDAVIHAATDEKERLSDLYWYYVRGRSAEKFEETVLRNSDNNSKPFVFNEKRFNSVGVPSRENPAPTDKVTINASTIPELASVLPFSSRAVKVNINPLADTAQVVFNPTEWTADDNGYSLKFAVYHPLRKKVFTLDENGEDTNGDGVLDTITIQKFIPTEDECFDYVYLLVSNVSLKTVSPINVALQTKAPSSVPENQILKKFVQICDPYYDYELLRTASFPAFGISSYLLEMTSGMWRGSQELYNAQPWKHYLTIIEPSIVLHDKAILLITGGSTGSEPDITDQAEMVLPFVSATGTVAVLLKAVPNQPLQFIDETKKRVEDGIIAYSYDKYMDGYKARQADITWPVLLPMVRSAVRAMDTVQKFVKEEKPGRRYDINNFVVTGASKRGWTTWLTSAVDPRVCAAMPIVIDVLNMPSQIEHHYYSYGEKYSPALIDYVSLGIFDRLGTPEGNSLWKIVDPINYLDSLTMPKFMLNSTGDQFFLPDSAKFYFNMLKPNITLTNGVVYPDNAYLYYAPNTDHGLVSSNALDLDENSYRALLAFYLSVINNRERPKFFWWVEQDTTETDIKKRAFRIRLDTITKPKEVLLWQATNKNTRDFRLSTIGLGWSSSKLKPFCEECGGDPGFDPEAIIDNTTNNEKSYNTSLETMNGAKSILGKLQNSDSQKVLYLEGTPYQMGYQYGSLLKDEITKLVRNENYSVFTSEDEKLAGQLQKDMPSLWNEITQGIADGSGLHYEQLLMAHIVWWKSRAINNEIDKTSIVSINSSKENKELLLTLWKPNNQDAFMTIDPIGLLTMNMVIKNTGESISIVNNTAEPLANNINKIQFVMDWLNTSIPTTVVESNNSELDLLYANKDAFYAIDLSGSKIKSVSIANPTIAEDKNWMAKYTPSTQTISLPSEYGDCNSLTMASLVDTMANFTIGKDNTMPINQQNASVQILKTNIVDSAKSYISAEGEGEGEGEPPCICEFGENEIIPYVGTVEVPNQGWTAFFIQIRFPGPEPYVPELKDLDYVFSTRVVVVPDTYPKQ